MRIVIALVAVLAGCSGGAHAPPAVQTPPTAIAPTAVMARVGEQMTYRVSVHDVEVATILYSIGPGELAGKDVLVIETRATSSPLLTWLHPVDDTLTSWIDPATGRPLAFKAVERASKADGDYEDSESTFAAGQFAVHTVRGDKTWDEQQIVHGEPYDTSAILTFVRSWIAEPGAQVTVDLMRSRAAWRTGLAVVEYGTLATALGELPVVRYDCQTVRLLRDGSEDPKSDRRKFTIWVTDDADRVPVKMLARTDYGDILVELAAYRGQ